MRKKSKAILFVSIITFAILSVYIFYKAGYRYNHTPSFPIGIYKLNKNDLVIKRGKLVLVCPPNSKIFKNTNKHNYISNGYCKSGYEPLIKKIAAIGGDKIVIDKFVYVNSIKQKNSRVYNYDSHGLELIHYPKKEFTLKPNQIFLLSDYNDKSFDSRYFGPLDMKLIQGSLKPLLTFNNN